MHVVLWACSRLSSLRVIFDKIKRLGKRRRMDGNLAWAQYVCVCVWADQDLGRIYFGQMDVALSHEDNRTIFLWGGIEF